MNDVDKYLKNIDPNFRDELERIRQYIIKLVPDAKEVISYGIPGFKLNGKYLCGYAGFKKHMSFFPASEAIEVLADKLKKYKTSRGTIQFTLDNPLSETLIKQLIKIRLNSIK